MVKTKATESVKDHQPKKRNNAHIQNRGVIISYLFKEEPPDASCITKPKFYQGKTLDSQRRMKPNLLYLGASGYTVSRSKPFQEGGNVTALNPVAEPEVHPTPHSPNQGAKQDICALKMPYLLNQEGLNHETNFHGFYTQGEVHPNWNFNKRPTEEEVMNFSRQRFSSPFICEHHSTLEGVSSPKKERPEPKPIINDKRSSLAFQEAQDHENGSSKPEDMINFPKPAKSVLHLPQLEANRFNQLQTRHWRPGDHFNQSGGILEVLSYTKTQEISWFNEDSLKSNQSYLWKDWTIFRFDPFQAIPIRPEDIKTKPRRPGDIIGVQEEFYKFIPCTSHHRIRRIPIYTKLPYLESQPLKLQQLFLIKSLHDTSTFQAFQKVPRKLSYPLKPSRYKEKTIYIYLAKILTIKPPTASFRFCSLFDFFLFLSFRTLESLGRSSI